MAALGPGNRNLYNQNRFFVRIFCQNKSPSTFYLKGLNAVKFFYYKKPSMASVLNLLLLGYPRIKTEPPLRTPKTPIVSLLWVFLVCFKILRTQYELLAYPRLRTAALWRLIKHSLSLKKCILWFLNTFYQQAL